MSIWTELAPGQVVPTVAVMPTGELATVAVMRCWRFFPAEVSSTTRLVWAEELADLGAVTPAGVVAVKLMTPEVAEATAS